MSYEPPQIHLPPPDPRSKDELRDLLDSQWQELSDALELAEFWRKRYAFAEQDGYYRGLIDRAATNVRYPPKWGGDGETFGPAS